MRQELTNKGVPGRWLRNTKDGTIYHFTTLLVANPSVEEVSEEVAFPENHIPAKQKGRKSSIDMTVDPADVKKVTPPKNKSKAKVALGADASKGLAGKAALKQKK
jgi:hypothetical protein